MTGSLDVRPHLAGQTSISKALVRYPRHNKENSRHGKRQVVDALAAKCQVNPDSQKNKAKHRVHGDGRRHRRCKTDTETLPEPLFQAISILNFCCATCTTGNSLPRIFTAIGARSLTTMAADADRFAVLMSIALHCSVLFNFDLRVRARQNHAKPLNMTGRITNILQS